MVFAGRSFVGDSGWFLRISQDCVEKITVIVSVVFLSMISWFLIDWLMVSKASLEIFLGMISPLLIGIGNLILVEKIYRKEPEKLTSFMAKAFWGKMVLYGVYFSFILGWYSLQAIPFVVSFTGYFVAFHVMEAFYFYCLFKERTDEVKL